MYVMQFRNAFGESQVGLVDENIIFPLASRCTLYELVLEAIKNKMPLNYHINTIDRMPGIYYQDLVECKSLLSPIHHFDSDKLLVSGTGLTHKNSTILRTNMYSNSEASDAQKIYADGLLNGKPRLNKIGAKPEWFFKGFGEQLKASGESLSVPGDSMNSGEEAELAVIYVIDETGKPYRVGFSIGNEFSDHSLEKENHYYLAQSKLHDSSIGPEIYLGSLPRVVNGVVTIYRDDEIYWKKAFKTGEQYMNHSLSNIEHHIFKHEQLCRPNSIHILFLGADVVSFSENITLIHNDEVHIGMDLFQFSLKNKIRMLKEERIIKVATLMNENQYEH